MQTMFLTGTRAYGPVREDSDYDLVIYRTDRAVLELVLSLLEIPIDYGDDEYDYDSCLKVELNGKILNLIVVDDEVEFLEWLYATNWMTKFSPVTDRDNRVAIFERSRKRFKDFFQGNKKNF